MACPELVLHVGLQQTGATMLRRALSRLRPQLRHHGIGLIGQPALARLAVDGWRCDEVTDAARVEAFERGLADAVDREVGRIRRDGSAPRAVVLSSDHLLGRRNLDARDERRFRPDAVASVAQVIRAIRPGATRIVLYVRRQDRLMEACYLRAIGNGGTHRFEDQFPQRFRPVLDHLELIERLESVPEVGEVRVRPFELVATTARTYADDLLSVLGLADRLDLAPVGDDLMPYRLLSARAAAIARDVAPNLDSPREHALLRDFLLQRFPGTDDAGTRVLTDEDRGRILAAYAPVNQRLFERRMPDLPSDAYADDAATQRLAATTPHTADAHGAGPPRGRARAVVGRGAAASAKGRGSAASHGRRRIRPAEAQRLLAVQLERERLAGHGPPEHDGADDTGNTWRVTDTLRSLTAALGAAEVPYLVVPPDGDHLGRVVVPEPHLRRTRRALRTLVGSIRLDLTDDQRSQDGSEVARRRRWDVHPLDGDGHDAGGAGCRLEFWPLDRDLPDRLWQHRWDAPAEVPYRGPATVEPITVGGRRYPTARSVAGEPDVDEVTFPIDVVYTWVDSNDPRWLARRRGVLGGIDVGMHPPDAADASRYRSYDELRYSLRSVARFADFVRHVFIVTDGQVPPWLDTGHHRLTVVDHREIFADPNDLPTFNSHAIESQLHHIPGLAEHYLYLNDDFFLLQPVPPERFFHANGMTTFFASPALIPDMDTSDGLRSVDAAATNTQRWMHERFGRRVEHKLKHTPYAQRRSVLFEMEEVFRDAFDRTAASRVRSPEDIAVPSSLSHYYAYLTGRAVPGRISSRYVSLDADDLARQLRKLSRRRDPEVLCINDAITAHGAELARRSRLLERFMASYWPTPSPFER